MRIPSSRNVRLLVAVCLVVGVGAVATVVQASIGGIGGGGVIQGCYDSGGNVKVVAALPCPKGYTALQWNQPVRLVALVPPVRVGPLARQARRGLRIYRRWVLSPRRNWCRAPFSRARPSIQPSPTPHARVSN